MTQIKGRLSMQFDPDWGEDIHTAVENAIHFAELYDMPVKLVFNGQSVVVTEESSVDNVVEILRALQKMKPESSQADGAFEYTASDNRVVPTVGLLFDGVPNDSTSNK